MALVIIFLTLFINCLSGINAKLPDYLKPCNHSDSNLSDCLKESIKFAVKELKEGNHEDIPSLEPFVVEQINQDLHVFKFKVNFIIKELCIYNLTNFQVNNITVSGNDYVLDLEFPDVRLNGQFLFDFKLGKKHFENIVGTGKGVLKDMKAHCVLKGKPIKVNNKDSLEFNEMSMKLEVENSNIIIHIKGYESLEKLVNMGVNRTGKRKNIIFGAALDDLEDIVKTKMLAKIHEMTFGYPMEELFPH